MSKPTIEKVTIWYCGTYGCLLNFYTGKNFFEGNI